MTKNPIEIDGAYGEGGGSILRIACALSVIMQKSVRIYNIRKNRPKPGLKMQHLVGLRALTEISKGKLENGKMGATEILFMPGKVTKGVYNIGVGTAGSIGLILQILQLACVQAEGEIVVNIKGGATFGMWAPTLPYLENVTIPQLSKMGYNIKVEVKRHGFYPKGGANVTFKIMPCIELKALKLEAFGNEITEINGISIASIHLKNRNVAKRQAKAAKDVITRKLGITPNIRSKYVDALNPGSGICLWLKTDSGVILGSDIIGEKGKPSEKIGKECAEYLCEIANAKATVDRFFSDQIIPFMALAKGTSIIKPDKITNHTKTNIWLVEQLLGKKFEINSRGDLHEIKLEN